jgi:hypothetical protein
MINVARAVRGDVCRDESRAKKEIRKSKASQVNIRKVV